MKRYFYGLLRKYVTLFALPQNSVVEIDPATPLPYILKCPDYASDVRGMPRQAKMRNKAVVSDIVMPRLNRVELVQALATTHPELPVILMTGYGAGALAERGIAAPCAVLAKPFAAERLLDEVRRCVKERL